LRHWEANAVTAACGKVAVEISTSKASYRALIQEGRRVRLSKRIPTGRRGVRFVCHPAEVFGNFTIEHFNTLSGFLRDQAALHQGMQAELECDGRNHGAWWFPKGLVSFVTQDDYGRFSLHPTPIQASATEGSLRVDVALRFVHSGPSRFWTWVNCEPVQGGAHLEGMGDALREVFPDETAGCRTIPLSTNTDTSAVVNLPHSLIGAMHVQTPDPKWAGPTRDILMGDDIREFVHKALVQSIAQQWKAGRAQQRNPGISHSP
jgi:DNA gyrase/topoisomerase IV subunit B